MECLNSHRGISHCYDLLLASAVAQLCLTLHKLMDCSPLVSFVHGILQARILEWVATSLVVYYKLLSRILCAIQ